MILVMDCALSTVLNFGKQCQTFLLYPVLLDHLPQDLCHHNYKGVVIPNLPAIMFAVWLARDVYSHSNGGNFLSSCSNTSAVILDSSSPVVVSTCSIGGQFL